MPDGYDIARLDELERIPSFQGVTWLPVRRRLGITGFGINAFEGDAGKLVIEDHDELGAGGSGRQEELYFVASGRATFTVGGADVDAPTGTFVFVRDPSARRKAVAEEDRTVILALGGTPGEPYSLSAWEWVAPALGLADAGDFHGAAAATRDGLATLPDHPSLLYNLACYEARAGDPESALNHLERGLEIDPAMREWAATDEDFASLAEDPRFAELVKRA